MAFRAARFDPVGPDATPTAHSARCRAALEMTAYADEHGVGTVRAEERRGVADSCLPSPFVFVGAVFGATRGTQPSRSPDLWPAARPAAAVTRTSRS